MSGVPIISFLLASCKRWAVRFIDTAGAVAKPPRGFFRQTDRWLASGSPEAASSRKREHFPATQRPRRFPLNVDVLPWQFQAYYGGATVYDEPGWVVEIPGGRVAGKFGVITPDNFLLTDVSRELIVGGDQSKHSLLQRRGLARVRRIGETAAVLSVASVNYWHWFFDLLPRALLVEKDQGTIDGIDAFVVNRMQKPYQRETLRELGIPENKIIESHWYGFHVRADRLLVPSVFCEVPAKWACTALRERFLEVDAKREKGSRRIYVSRSDANSRRVLNESLLVEQLGRLGFERVTLSGMSVAEQSGLFASAEFVVAPHGAGLTNLIFCGPGTKVLELFSPTYVNPCYWVLSDHMELDYYCVIGEGFRPPEPPPETDIDAWFNSFADSDTQYGKDIMANVEEIVELVEGALKKE